MAMDEFPEIGSNWCPLCLKFTQSTEFEDITYPNDEVALARFRVRVRKCPKCEISFETYEINRDEYNSNSILREKIRKLKSLANKEPFDLTSFKMILNSDEFIEPIEPEAFEKVQRVESEGEAEIFDDKASEELFSNWDSDRFETASDNSDNPEDETPPF